MSKKRLEQHFSSDNAKMSEDAGIPIFSFFYKSLSKLNYCLFLNFAFVRNRDFAFDTKQNPFERPLKSVIKLKSLANLDKLVNLLS